MRIGQATGQGKDLRITALGGATTLTIEMTWAEWDELRKDAEHLRATGRFRDVGLPGVSVGSLKRRGPDRAD